MVKKKEVSVSDVLEFINSIMAGILANLISNLDTVYDCRCIDHLVFWLRL